MPGAYRRSGVRSRHNGRFASSPGSGRKKVYDRPPTPKGRLDRASREYFILILWNNSDLDQIGRPRPRQDGAVRISTMNRAPCLFDDRYSRMTGMRRSSASRPAIATIGPSTPRVPDPCPAALRRPSAETDEGRAGARPSRFDPMMRVGSVHRVDLMRHDVMPPAAGFRLAADQLGKLAAVDRKVSKHSGLLSARLACPEYRAGHPGPQPP